MKPRAVQSVYSRHNMRKNERSRQKLPTANRRKKSQQSAPSQGGSSCHQCKSRRNCSDLTYCTSFLDNKKKKCRKKYCEHCLKKFYRELPAEASEKPTWKCPSCRKICCCAACRRREQRHAALAGGSVMRAGVGMGVGADYPSYAEGGSGGPFNPFGQRPENATNSFKALYAIAQMPSVKKHIKYILGRQDITDKQRVESIATLLRGSSSKVKQSSDSAMLPTESPAEGKGMGGVAGDSSMMELTTA